MARAIDRKRHWESVYATKAEDQVGWFQPSAARSLSLIGAAGIEKTGAIIDVGGGTSSLVDELLSAGYTDVTVLDIAGPALAKSRQRLGDRAAKIEWIEADVTTVELPKPFELWHDRAVFHFLTEQSDRRAYLDRLKRYLQPGGHVIIATFALYGPARCSGLPVQRYSEDTLTQTLGPDFELRQVERELHRTPAGHEQAFVYCRFERRR